MYVCQPIPETLNKSIHTPLSDEFSRRGIDGKAVIQHILSAAAKN